VLGLDDEVAAGAAAMFIAPNFIGDGHQFNLNIDDVNNRMFGAAVNPRINVTNILNALGSMVKGTVTIE
jgi:hypothetical protein